MIRTVVAWCPDWPLVAAGYAGRPAAVLRANRIVSCSAPARAEGVAVHQRRREAESACPDLVIVPESQGRDVRAFEVVVAAVARFTPLIEVTRPGVCSLPERGPARYFGGTESLAQMISAAGTQAAREVGGPASPSCRVGVADSPWVARLAAREASGGPVIVPTGQQPTAEWLAPLGVGVLGSKPLGEMLRRLGVLTLGEFAQMDEGVVTARLGTEGGRAHRLARGLDDHRLVLGEAPPDLSVQLELDDPVDQVETVAFIASGLAEELVSRLSGRGYACTKVLVEASTEHAEETARWWRGDRPFTARTMVDRVRWQLEGWAPTSGVTLVRLTAGEVVPDSGRQLGLFGGPSESTERVERAVARVQGLLGHESIGSPVIVGGRGPLEQVRFIPWGEPRGIPAVEAAAHPWPGHLPPPAPPVVYASPIGLTLRDASDEPVEVSGRGRLSGPPARLFLSPGREQAITGWAGPWPSDERWWDPALHRRRARMQVLLEDGSAHVLVLEQGSWSIEASYD